MTDVSVMPFDNDNNPTE